MAEMLTPVCSLYVVQSAHADRESGGLHAKQYRMGVGQVEGRLQGTMDLCARYPQRQLASHPTQVRRLISGVWHRIDSGSSNTQERKPVTNSRDTQELLPEAGQEMLRIFHTHPARTSLLQDFAFYEVSSISFWSLSVTKTGI